MPSAKLWRRGLGVEDNVVVQQDKVELELCRVNQELEDLELGGEMSSADEEDRY